MPIVYFLIAVALFISWIWRPLLFILGGIVVLYLIRLLINCYKSKPKRFLYGMCAFVLIGVSCFAIKLCSDNQQENEYRKIDTIHGLEIIRKNNIEITPQQTISYKHINDSLNKCINIDYNLILDTHTKLLYLEGYTYHLYKDSEFQGSSIKYENNYGNKHLLEDINNVIKTLCQEFGKPHFDNSNGRERTTKWQFDRLHILIYCYQQESHSNGSISIYNPEILNIDYSPIDRR